MFRKACELGHERADAVLFAGIGNIGDIDEDTDALAVLFMKAADFEDIGPFCIGQSKARRVVGRRIEDDEQRILAVQDMGNSCRERGRIEMALVIHHRERMQIAADFLAQAVIDVPAPVRRQDGIADFRIVGNGNVDGTGAA